MTAGPGPQVLTVPGSPVLLVRAGGRLDPARALRRDCLDALAPALSGTARVIVLGAGPETVRHDPEARYDLGRLIGRDRCPAPAGRSLPVAAAIGRELVRKAGWTGPLSVQAVDPAASPEDCRRIAAELQADADDLLVAVGDGSALRRPGGPGPVHPQAAAYDTAVLEAWRTGDRDAILALDPGLAAELMVTGRAPWQVAAAAAGTVDRTEIHYADDPYGVFHLIASWR